MPDALQIIAAIRAQEPVAWLHDVVSGDGEKDQVLSFTATHFPLPVSYGFESAQAHPLCLKDDRTDLLEDLQAEVERLTRERDEARADAERLAFAYSGARTESSALVEIELRLLSGEVPTIEEVRAAIDDAKEQSNGS